jgi:hypothetical protein
MKIILQNFNFPTKFYTINPTENKTISSLLSTFNLQNLENNEYFITSNGKILNNSFPLNELYNNQILTLHESNLGGKGGFGTLLKRQNANKKMTNNVDACRDLTGRRIRHVNQERLLKEWEEKKQEENNIINNYNKKGKINFGMTLKEEKLNEYRKENEKYYKEKNRVNKIITNSSVYLIKKRKREIELKNKENQKKKNTKQIKKNNNNNEIKNENKNNILNNYSFENKTKEELLDEILF